MQKGYLMNMSDIELEVVLFADDFFWVQSIAKRNIRLLVVCQRCKSDGYDWEALPWFR